VGRRSANYLTGVTGLRGLRDCGDAEADGLVAGAPVDLGELVAGAGEADLESFDLAGPAFASGFGDAGDEVVTDLGNAVPLAGRWPVHAAPQKPVN